MKKNLLLLFTFSLLLFSACKTTHQTKQQNTVPTFRYQVDLTAYHDDQLDVVLHTADIAKDTVEFCFPKIVPGIYGPMNFGQYIQHIVAQNKTGNALNVQQKDTNSWFIFPARDLAKITYTVNDSWEEFDANIQEGFYRSAAATFKEDIFLINNNCLFGYLKGFEKRPIVVDYKKPKGFYAATSLPKQILNEQEERFTASSYHFLVDNPMMYALPDTAQIHIDNTTVEVACYSVSKEKIAQDVAAFIRPLLLNQKQYLGGKLPVDKYTFMIYYNPMEKDNSYAGDGLEHSNSTITLMSMAFSKKMIRENVYAVASHEFFHTLMPLGLHSFEIANYDFAAPKFSKHLWLYEGMTEYFTIHSQVKHHPEQLENFLTKVNSKIKDAKQYGNDLPFTTLSKNVMQYQDQYYNVYLKGTLINMCMDIQLRSLSEGKYGVQDLVAQLLKKYGKDKPFEDDALFDEIINTSKQPALHSFIASYIEGTTPLPLKETLFSVGITYDNDKKQLVVVHNPTAAQLQLRKYWIGF